ncbi:hypothetical protein CHARACLAT_017796 [Characodon lateralis]|uniref:Uncharacterized protein n=1 Tax=Characodon lateralis TaxID=208331 RepID=A0ABU7D8D7_9TELE|nr:hypothetical protein [Characodon lateralis]
MLTYIENIKEMEQGSERGLIRAETLRFSKDPSVKVWCHRVMVSFMLSCLFDWILEPDTEEQLQREQTLKLRQSRLDLDGRLLQLSSNSSYNEIEEERRVMSKNGGQNNVLKRFTICCKTNEGAKNPLQYTGAAYLNGCKFRFRQRKPYVGVDQNTADRREAQTGLNLHFILVILFSTNKLKPEKT